ncbi:ABC1-domain-containing protein [Violaceomyces palustris]|uniref:ABC1-domain-containing protein n=1 Tax=Violaceomyces palustris TaxID=1673888 RepID=A0ACD0P8V4_9BASI|nr:ABC1-domain-containing protein [Violaceomyces palustris]
MFLQRATSCRQAGKAIISLPSIPTPLSLGARRPPRCPLNSPHPLRSHQLDPPTWRPSLSARTNKHRPHSIHRLHSFSTSSSSSSRPGSDSRSSSASGAKFLVAGLAALATGATLYTLSPFDSKLASDPIQPDIDPSLEDNHEFLGKVDYNRFAPSLEELDEYRMYHSNTLIRSLQRFGSLIRVYILEPLGTTKRFIVLLLLFAPVILTAPMLFVGRRREGGRRRGRRVSKKEEGERWGAVWWYGFLVKQMERAGPTFIKLAQWAGSRQDLFPNELCLRLGRLHSNGKPHSFRYTKKVIEGVFQRPFEEIFEEFGHEPLGIGAVAQVYKATLKPDLLPPTYLEAKSKSPRGIESKKLSHKLALTYHEDAAPPAIPTAAVAIKVLHPRVERTIGRDIKIMSFFAKLINLIPGAEWLSFPEEVEVFSEMMFSQLDLRNEAQNLKRFEENFKKRRGAISFPRPLIEFSTKQLLIEEFEEALPLKHFLNMGGAGFDHRIANLGLDAFLNMLLIDNFTHADLHPGNIMIKFYRPTTKSLLHDLSARILSKFDSDYAAGAAKAPPTADEQAEDSVLAKLIPLRHDQDKWLDELENLDALGYQPEIVLLDAGLTVELSPKNRRNFLDLFSAVAEFNGALAGKLMVERCRSPELVVDEEGFAMKMQDLVLSVKSKTFSLAKIKISDVLNEVLSAVRGHHVKMEADFVNTVISILLLEGIGRQLDPHMDLFKSALPILRSLGKQISKQGGSRMIHHDQGSPSSGEDPDEGVPAGIKEALPMLKLWLYMEARSLFVGFLDASPSTVDAFVRYGWTSD